MAPLEHIAHYFILTISLSSPQSNSSSWVSIFYLHHGQHDSSDQGHSYVEKNLHYLLLKPGLQMLHAAFIQRLPSITLPKRCWSTFHPNAPTRALLPATNDDVPLAGSLCRSVSPIYHPITTVGMKKPRNQRNLTASKKIRLIRGT